MSEPFQWPAFYAYPPYFTCVLFTCVSRPGLEPFLAGDDAGASRVWTLLMLVLKGYLHDRLGLRTQGQTTDKIAEALKAKTDQEKADAVRNTLHLCDRVKFAGHQPSSAEMDRAYEVTRALIETGGARHAVPLPEPRR